MNMRNHSGIPTEKTIKRHLKQNKNVDTKITTFHKSKRIIHQTKSSRKTLMRSPNCTASSPVFPLFLPPSIALVLFLLLPPAHSRALSLFPSLSLPLSLCLSFSPLSPRPVCMNNVLPFVMRARGEKNTLGCSPAPRSDIENEWQLTWMPIFIRLTPGWQHSLYSPTQAVTSAISDPSHHLPPPLSLPVPLAAERTPPRFRFHWRYSMPYRAPRALHAHLRFISGGARWPPIGIKRDLHSAAGRLGCSPRDGKQRKPIYFCHKKRENLPLGQIPNVCLASYIQT